MRKILTLLPGLALASALFAQAPLAPKPGTNTPRPSGEFVFHMPDGSQKLLTSYRGKFVVLAFMYTTCGHCQHAAGLLAKIQTDYASKGVQVLGAVFDADASHGIPAFVKLTGANFPVGFSTPDQVVKFMHADGDYFVPMLAFIDRAGTVKSQIVSFGDPNSAADKFLSSDDEDSNIRKEIDKYLKPAAAAPKQAPKS